MIRNNRLKLAPVLLAVAAVVSCSSNADKGDLTDILEQSGLTGEQATCVATRLDDELTSEQLDAAARAETEADLEEALGPDASENLPEWVADCLLAGSDVEANSIGSDVAWLDTNGTESADTEPENARPVSSREAPIPLGTPTDVADGWTVTIRGYNRDASAAVAAANEFNDVAPVGSRYVTTTVDATYAGADDKQSLYTVSFKAVGPSGTTYQASDCSAALAQPVDVFADVFVGATVSGDLCFVVAEADADGLVVYTDALDADFSTVTTYFATA